MNKNIDQTSKHIEKANQYIKENKDRVTNRPLFHFTAPIGWLNDPNGLCYFNGEYHLYYQYNPYDIKWDLMHWGHAVSSDLVNWHHKGLALGPDEAYEIDGCFSGSAIEKDGKLFIMYTGHLDPGKDSKDPEWRRQSVRENQNLAVSQNGDNFLKSEVNPVIDTGDLPAGMLPQDFRDPKIIEKDGIYYCVLAARNERYKGVILLYRSLDLMNWNYVGTIAESHNPKEEILECPDLIEMSGKDLLILSAIDLHEPDLGEVRRNLHPTYYCLGNVDFEDGKGQWESRVELDCGFNFYAPQSFVDHEGRRIMIGWISPWDADEEPRVKNGWAGMMSVPRVLSLRDGALIQEPVESIKSLRKKNYVLIQEKSLVDECKSFDGVEGRRYDLSFKVDMTSGQRFMIEVGKGKGCTTSLTYDKKQALWSFDRRHNGEKNMPIFDKLNQWYSLREIQDKEAKDIMDFRILLDNYCLEIFADGGRRVFTAMIDPHLDGRGIDFSANGSCIIQDLEFYLLDNQKES